MTRPIIILKYAIGLNGAIGSGNTTSSDRVIFSNDEDKAEVNLLRSKVDGILVGGGTVLADNPSLLAMKNKSEPYKTQPTKIILKGNRNLPKDLKIFDESLSKTIILNSQVGTSLEINLKELKDSGIKSILVEGGGKVISSFLEWGSVSGGIDAIRILFSPKLDFEGSVFTELSKDINLSNVKDFKVKQLGDQYALTVVLSDDGAEFIKLLAP